MDELGTPLGEAFARLARADPDRPAVTDADATVTRAELEASSNRLARAYAQLGVGVGDYVTIGLPNGIGFVEAALATWKLGAVPQPVSARLPDRELSAILDLAAPALVVGLDAPGRTTVPLGFRPDPALADGPLPTVVGPSLKAPTSGGSTGRPKIIVSTQAPVLEQAVAIGLAVRVPVDGVALMPGPLYHNGPLVTATAALFLGCHLVVMPRFDAARTVELVARHRVDWLYAVPTMLHRMAKLPDLAAADLSSLQTVVTMAAACPEWLKRFWIERVGARTVVELYGATEAQAVTVIDGEEWLAHPGSVGRPVVGELSVRDGEGRELPPGEVGEVWMRRSETESGPYRYLGAQPREAAGGWQSVGDMGHVDVEGYLYLADRVADLILVGGSNVYPAEVEAALDEHPAVGSSCVIGLPDPEYGEVVHAIVQTTLPVTDDELLAHLAARLVRYKLPRSIERVDRPLRDDTGKVRRAALRAERIQR
ncbi:AMP-binding protein [Pseudonocardia sp. CA-107938]|uniref:AMP-binding protein n=1 Tax=Pseudonocardia sp. CA-107938 TaxID=3240021 RepID=UPI003D93CF47